uniref:Laminin G domain-containing protein n=1 Tax=Panagrolaimus sp. JU765 TaxID=591449 RepID=A0AC34R6B2_9BILA
MVENGKVLEEAKKEGARYGASETSHSRLTFDRPYPDPKNFAISFSFRTETSDGIIWIWANYKNYTRYFLMYIEDGFLMIDIQGSQNKKQLQYKEKRFDDGQWHELKLTKENRELTVQVDDLLSEKITDAASPSVMRRRMYVGGVISKHKKIFKFPHDNFIGCIKNFIVDGNEKDLHAQTRDVILCKKTKDIAYLHKGGFMTFAPLKSFNGPATDNQNIDVSIKFRTNNATGTLLALLSSSGFESKTGVLVEIKNNDLIFKADHAANGVQLEHKLH